MTVNGLAAPSRRWRCCFVWVHAEAMKKRSNLANNHHLPQQTGALGSTSGFTTQMA